MLKKSELIGVYAAKVRECGGGKGFQAPPGWREEEKKEKEYKK